MARHRETWNRPNGRTTVPQRTFNARRLEERAEEVPVSYRAGQLTFERQGCPEFQPE
jgi:hypothetical protein